MKVCRYGYYHVSLAMLLKQPGPWAVFPCLHIAAMLHLNATPRRASGDGILPVSVD